MVLIVVGSTLEGERHGRPLAYSMRERMVAWLAGQGLGGPEAVVVCSDIWYMCQDALRGLPAVAIGGPESNALSAHLADKLPGAFVIDDVLMVQLDPEFPDVLASCWGVSPEATARACEAFVERYLGAFMGAAAGDGASPG